MHECLLQNDFVVERRRVSMKFLRGKENLKSPPRKSDAAFSTKARILRSVKKRHKMKKAILKTGGGKYVQVRRNKRKEVKLCAVDSQDHNTSVFIQTRKKDDTMQMAFQFKYGNEYYSPKVEGADIKLEKVPVPEKPPTLESHWFERVNMQSGEVYSLKSVVETPQYVTIQTDGSPLSLTTEPRQCLYIKDDERA